MTVWRSLLKSRYLQLTLITLSLFVVTFFAYVGAEKDLEQTYRQRIQSFLLADELRQSSDDLTRMVRSYVATKDARFKRFYHYILAIRDGKIARPADYHQVYWDLLIEGVPYALATSEAIPLLDLMRRAGFTADEFAKLAKAKTNSDLLTETEYRAMALIEASPSPTDDQVEKALSMLYDTDYHQAKLGIMQPIREFQEAVDLRTLEAIDRAGMHAERMRLIFIVLGFSLVLCFWQTVKANTREKWLAAESEARYRTEFQKASLLLRHASDGTHILDQDGYLVDCSEIFCSMLGYSRDELSQMHVHDWDVQFDSNQFAQFVGSHDRKSDRFEFITQYRRKDRTVIDVEVSAYSLLLTGQPLVFFTARDITERRFWEQELRNSEKRFKDLVLTIGDWLWEVDVAGHYTYVSERVSDCLGYSPEEMLGKTPFEFMHPDDVESVRASFQSIVLTRQAFYDLENKNIHKDGSIRYLLTSAIPIVSDDGELIGYRGTDKDITGRKAIENKLANEQTQLRLILNSTAEAIYGVDRDNRCLFANQSCIELLGYQREDELIGKNMHALIHHSYPDGHLFPETDCQLHRNFETGTETHVDLDFFWRQNGDCFPVEYWGRPYCKDGQMIGAVVTFIDISQRQAQEWQMRLADEALRHTNTATFLADTQGRLVDVNQAACRMLGYEREELLASNVIDIDVNATPSSWQIHVEQLKQSGSVRIESSHRHKKGNIVPVELSISYFESYGMAYVLGLATDITERKQAERVTKQYQAIVQSSDDAIIGQSLTGLFTSWNPGAEKIFGYRAEDMLGQPIFKLLPAELIDEEIQLMERIRNGESIEHFESVYVCKDGTALNVSVVISPIFDDRGAISGASKIVRDITRRKKIEAELETYRWHLEEQVNRRTAEIQALYNRLRDTQFAMDSVGICVQVADFETGRFIECNRYVLDLLGYTSEEFLQLHIFDIDPNFSWEAYKKIRGDIQQQGTMQFESVQRTKAGRLIPVEVTIHYQRARSESSSKFIAFVTDITLRKENERLLLAAKEAAEKAAQLKSNFLANMSHEIRTPMNAVLGFCYLLEQRPLDDDATQLVNKIHTAGRSLLNIINDILDFSKIEAGKLEIERAPFLLSDLLDEVSVLMTPEAQKKALEFSIIPPRAVEGMIGDEQRIFQVLINLIGNAIKFTEQGEIELRVELLDDPAQGEQLCFRLRDTGIGISAEKQAEIFSAFTQADSTISRRFGGTGLGLAISRQLVNLMGGDLKVVSQEGEGSEFSFTLPLQRSAVSSSTSAQTYPDRLSLLVVDDSATAREALAKISENLGWQVKTVDSGDAALIEVLSHWENEKPYDVLLLDWQMPGKNGLLTAQNIKQVYSQRLDKTHPLPIIIMVTAYDREQLLAQNGLQWVDTVLTKPVTPSVLRNTVAKLFDQQQADSRIADASVDKPSEDILGARILVVDDSEFNLELAEMLLKSYGAEVALAGNGQEALDWLSLHADAIDLILMDVQMPVMDGYTATSRIREQARWRSLPIIALSAGVFKDEQERALAAGMTAFVSKPFNPKQLVKTIRHYIRPVETNDVDASNESTDEPNQATASFSLPGCDIQAALATWGSETVYFAYLKRFIDNYGNVGSDLTRLIGDDDLDSAVANQFQTIEAKIKNGGLAGESIANLQQMLNQLARSMPTRGPDSAEESVIETTQKQQVNSEALKKQLEHLQKKLEQHSPASVEPLLQSLQGQLSNETLVALKTAVSMFDFREAKAIVGKTLMDLSSDHNI